MKQHQSIRLFKSPILEAFTHIPPYLPFIIWIPIVIWQLVLGFQTGSSAPLVVLLFAAGAFFWSFTEYGMHRFVFHFDAKSKVTKYLVFLLHGIHHDDPVDPTRLVFPPVLSIPLGYLFYTLFAAVMGVSGHPFFSGFIAGYLVYDYIHFAAHHFHPKTGWGKALKENHMKHHYIKKGGKWGVSSPFWDHVFNTFNRE